MQYPELAGLHAVEVCKFTCLGWFNSFCSNTLRNGPNVSYPTMNISNGVQGAGRIDVPQFQYLMLPLLKVMGGGHEMSTIQIRDAVADNLFMTAEVLSQHLPTGPQNAFNNSTEWVQYLPIESQNKINNRMGWAITFSYKACLLERPRKATYIRAPRKKRFFLALAVHKKMPFGKS